MDGLKFDFFRAECPITFVMPDGTEKNYMLKEMDAASRENYLQDLNTRMESRDGVMHMKRLDGLNAALLTRCLYYADSLKPVEAKEIGSWPAAIVEKVFDKAKEMAGLDDKAEATAKND